ncbi:unnamed protein product [Prorocentrum cordatum]|uniref:Uncharacterized protein n=1 Tax=Prorocentrum cordatum TaxID=2364126 RepID=A0ABN9RA07_9DINO|nr:unnamed protein product [Polarella glacialis]
MATAYCRDLAAAQQNLGVLLRIRRRVGVERWRAGASLGLRQQAWELRFREAFAEEIRELGIGAVRSMQLHFFAAVPAKTWVGIPLCTPCFGVADGLEGGMRAWRRLSDARGAEDLAAPGRRQPLDQMDAAWSRLRKAYVDVWAESGRCPHRIVTRMRSLDTRYRLRRRLLVRGWRRPRAADPEAPWPQGRRAAVVRVQRRLLRLLSRWAGCGITACCKARSQHGERRRWSVSRATATGPG